MAKAKIELNSAGVRALLKSQEMMDLVSGIAYSAQNRLTSGYEVSTHVGKNRVNARVETKTYLARRDNLNNNSLLKAVGG